VWEQIKPPGKPIGGGLLCPSCIGTRLDSTEYAAFAVVPIDELERLRADLDDIRQQLRGMPESVLTGENGLAAATMRSHDALLAIVEPLNRLRANEGASVKIFHDNATFDENGRNCCVAVSDQWTGDVELWFFAESVAAALAAAEAAKATIEAIEAAVEAEKD